MILFKTTEFAIFEYQTSRVPIWVPTLKRCGYYIDNQLVDIQGSGTVTPTLSKAFRLISEGFFL
jgi:hypothetical protein